MAEEEPRDWTQEEQQEYFELYNARTRIVRVLDGRPRLQIGACEPSSREAELFKIHNRRELWRQRRIQALSDQATAVLMALLSPEQRKSAQEKSRFTMTGSDGKEYTIDLDDWQGNVLCEDRYGRFRRVCAHISTETQWLHEHRAYPPAGEHHLAQYLMIKANAPEFVATAL